MGHALSSLAREDNDGTPYCVSGGDGPVGRSPLGSTQQNGCDGDYCTILVSLGTEPKEQPPGLREPRKT